jgi:F-type H+-transporting ATPase subunit b
VWLLKRFLYKPILNAIDEREKKIESQLKDADNRESVAKKEQDEFKKKNEQFDQEKKKRMDKAVVETNVERDKLLEIARNEAAELRVKLQRSLSEMQENLNRDIAQKTQQEVFAIARKTLTDLASQSLEEQSTTLFIKRINELKKEEKQQFINAFKSESSPILIGSAFDLPKKQQSEIQNVVTEILGTETHFQFKTAPEIISGIELTSNGYKVAWSISEYLNSLQKNISEIVTAKIIKDETNNKTIEVPIQSPKKTPAKKPKEVPLKKPDSITEKTLEKAPITKPKAN